MSDDRTRLPSRRYAVLSKDTVRQFAESAGYANLPDEVTEVLAEDVSYRLRDLIQQSCEFMKNAKRRKMLTKDFTAALRNSDVQPIFGHGLSEPLTYSQTKEAEIFFYNDAEVNLPNLALGPAPYTNHPGRTTFRGTWLAVEGVRTGSALPQVNAQGKQMERGPKPLSEDSLLYFDMVTRAILGTDEATMKVALKDLRTNSRLLPLLPYLVNFVANGVKTVSHDTAQLGRLLHTVKALVMNPCIFLEPKPYLTMLVQTIEYCGIEPLAASINPQNDHWTLRDYAAHLLGLITRKWASPMNQLKQLNLKTLREVLVDNSRPFCTHYGAVMGLLALGLQAVHDVVLPLLTSYWSHLEEALHDCSYTNAVVKSDAQKVYGALLLVTEYIVRAHNQQVRNSTENKQDGCKEVLPNEFGRPETLQMAPQPNPVFGGVQFTGGQFSGAVITVPDNETPAPHMFSDTYNQLYEYFGDSLAARLPIMSVPNFYAPRKEPCPVSFADEDTGRTGEELLQRFLDQPSGSKRTASDGHADEKLPEEMDVDDKSNPSVCSARSSRSDENLSYMGDDADLTIKATVNDPSRGIKLTILKRPKTKTPSTTTPQPLAPTQQHPSQPPILLPQTSILPTNDTPAVLKKIPKLGRKSSLPKSTRRSDVFELTPLRERDVIFVFSFQGRVQHCVFSERQKALILARDMALQHAAVSKYRSMCALLPTHGKRSKSYGSVKKQHLLKGAISLDHIL